jgi:ribosomal-protein-alanine N-acetyltransferase
MTSDKSGDFRLLECGPDGQASELPTSPPPAMAQARQATLDHYGRVGFHPPWIGYLAVVGHTMVGGGAFVGPPRDNRVEIAYFTLPEHEAQGYATLTAAALVSIARDAQRDIEVCAKTAPELNASTAILTRLGFQQIGTEIDHEIGEAWAWVLAP